VVALPFTSRLDSDLRASHEPIYRNSHDDRGFKPPL
jgi:hypothetical protein